jgi:hypothetical protein
MIKQVATIFALAALAGCGNKSSRAPKSGLVLMTAPGSWTTLLGTEVQIIGKVSRTKVPTILGVEIDSGDLEPGKRASAIGVIDAVVVRERDPGEPPVATRAPGTYYRLINPKTNKLAVAEPVHDDR